MIYFLLYLYGCAAIAVGADMLVTTKGKPLGQRVVSSMLAAATFPPLMPVLFFAWLLAEFTDKKS